MLSYHYVVEKGRLKLTIFYHVKLRAILSLCLKQTLDHLSRYSACYICYFRHGVSYEQFNRFGSRLPNIVLGKFATFEIYYHNSYAFFQKVLHQPRAQGLSSRAQEGERPVSFPPVHKKRVLGN